MRAALLSLALLAPLAAAAVPVDGGAGSFDCALRIDPVLRCRFLHSTSVSSPPAGWWRLDVSWSAGEPYATLRIYVRAIDAASNTVMAQSDTDGTSPLRVRAPTHATDDVVEVEVRPAGSGVSVARGTQHFTWALTRE